MLYAHAVIELPDGSKIQRGAQVPEDLEGLDELVEAGSVSEDSYDPAADKVDPPDVVEIEGFRYIKATDGGEGGSDAALA